MSFWIQLLAQVFSIAVGTYSFRKRSVSLNGLVALLIISSLIIWLNQINLLLVLFYMFASSSIITHIAKSKKYNADIEVKEGPRDHWQAIANLGIATLLILIYHYRNDSFILAAILGSVSAANADSWASEIGRMSKGKVYLITNLKPVQKGISGGVTFIGTIGGIGGSLFITCVSLATFFCMSADISNWKLLFLSSFFAGIFGFILDSYLGAVFQSLYFNSSNQRLSEIAETDSTLLKGIRWMNNDLVNFLTTFMGALVGGCIYYIFQ